MDSTREEDPELSNIREFFELWLAYDLGLDDALYDQPHHRDRVCTPAPNDFNPPVFKEFLLRVAAARQGGRLGSSAWDGGCAKSAGASLPNIG